MEQHSSFGCLKASEHGLIQGSDRTQTRPELPTLSHRLDSAPLLEINSEHRDGILLAEPSKGNYYSTLSLRGDGKKTPFKYPVYPLTNYRWLFKRREKVINDAIKSVQGRTGAPRKELNSKQNQFNLGSAAKRRPGCVAVTEGALVATPTKSSKTDLTFNTQSSSEAQDRHTVRAVNERNRGPCPDDTITNCPKPTQTQTRTFQNAESSRIDGVGLGFEFEFEFRSGPDCGRKQDNQQKMRERTRLDKKELYKYIEF
ncbi:hypothetical protein AYI68_g1983 [Smittium mucronatum]|uniref:Uncharacterized protein n=1 Tax=Smittium mucronatum TaxID=133383 RepID=A0A1R0H402_9FUNG|nr:hypothetical protein AYI68_g1983 [Smittium mucronatum]